MSLHVAHDAHEDHFQLGDESVEVSLFFRVEVALRFIFQNIKQADGVAGGFGVCLPLAGVRIGSAECHLNLNSKGFDEVHELRSVGGFVLGLLFHRSLGFEGSLFLSGFTFPIAINFLFELYHRDFFVSFEVDFAHIFHESVQKSALSFDFC